MGLGNIEQRTGGMKRQAQELIEQAYQRGYALGQELREVITFEKECELIEQGRNEAWRLALHIFRLNQKERKAVFGYDRDTVNVLESMDASEVLEKIRAYEEKKQKKDEEIKVGDVIQNHDDVEAVVTWCDGKNWNGFLLGGEGVGEVGQVYSCMRYKGWKKTGRTFPEIAEVLKKLKEDE